MNLTDDEGNLYPAIRNLINIVFLLMGLIFGWFAHANWIHRGEAAQIVEDMEIGTQIEQTRLDRIKETKKRIEDSDHEYKDECLNHSNTDYVDSLRDSLGDEEF